VAPEWLCYGFDVFCPTGSAPWWVVRGLATRRKESMLPNLGPTELILIFLIVLLLFGANRIPEIAKGFGKGIRDFKRGMSGIDEEIKKDDPPRIEPKQ
jgi:sec-independent protein translocase protein TatA